jgi:hypothetical protein
VDIAHYVTLNEFFREKVKRLWYPVSITVLLFSFWCVFSMKERFTL